MSQRSTAREESQPLAKPRALILDLFGDYLRYSGPEVKAADLITLLGVFGVEPATVRVTLSRLRREDWFTSLRQGREVTYVLSDHMLGVLQAGRERIFADYDEPWDKTWTTIVQQSLKGDRLTRDQLRRELSWLGFGSLSPSTWLAPRDRCQQARALTDQFPDVQFTVLRAYSDDLAVDRELAARGWDLERINLTYEQFLKDNADLAGLCSGDLVGEDALIARTGLIESYRHFPFLDPWFPAELRPRGWFGAAANELFTAAHRALGPDAAAFVSEVVGHHIEAPVRA